MQFALMNKYNTLAATFIYYLFWFEARKSRNMNEPEHVKIAKSKVTCWSICICPDQINRSVFVIYLIN